MSLWGSKTTSNTNYFAEPEPQYTAEQRKRIASYLEENDRSCKESTSLILCIVIGLLVSLSVVGFIAMHNHPSLKYKGSHTTYEHLSSNTSILDTVWSKWNWLQNLYFNLNNSTRDSTELRAIIALEEELNDFQPLYRNPLLQQLYSKQCDDYTFISIKHGSWIPSKQYLEEALDFSWTDFEDQQLKEEIESVASLNKEDIDKTKTMRRLNPKGVFGNKKHLKHLDEIRKENMDKMKAPKDVLKAMDLSEFGVDPIDEQTTDKEKKADLAKLEEQEAKRHPFMTLLTNPGVIDGVECAHRKHEVVFTAEKEIERGDDVSVFEYGNNVLMWYCYLVQIDGINGLNGGSFKVNLTFDDVDLETGFDYVNIYINSMITESVSGIGLNWEDNEERPQFVYYIDANYVETNGNALEICMKIVTDSSIIHKGFKSILSVDYDDPLITKWSKWTDCTTKKVWHYKGRDGKNDKHWDGKCGIGIRSKKVIECMNNPNATDHAPCNLDETVVERCIKANCSHFPTNQTDLKKWCSHAGCNAEQDFKFNGHGRVDPYFADPFLVQRSKQETFNINNIIQQLSLVRDEIIARYPDERALSTAVINHYYMDQSKLRLGIRLARSLLLGDTFTVYTTGSSNTAGHENMFMSTYPMQFQSIMRPLWRRVGYKGAAFVVKNHAEGGGLGTIQLGPCIPSLIGDDADVVYWESQMNDKGVLGARENHFRNAITLPRRPLYHVMHAGKNGPSHPGTWEEQYEAKNGKQGQFANENSCYGWVCGEEREKGKPPTGGLNKSPYTDYGAGITMFYPTAGLGGINKTRYGEFATWRLYYSFHPACTGQRVYAEQMAYYYLTCALETFADIKDLIDDLTPPDKEVNKPIEEMLEILEDPPTTKDIPNGGVAGNCDPVCSNATEAVCLCGYRVSIMGKPRYNLKRWRQKHSHDEDIGKWEYYMFIGNPQSILYKDGGLGSIDLKMVWQTSDKESNEFKVIFEAKQYGFVNVEADKIAENVKDKKVEIKIYEIDMETGLRSKNPKYKNHGKAVECINKEIDKDVNWMVLNSRGCNFGGFEPYQKYEMVVNLIDSVLVGIRNIRVY